jgi:EpsI family protein
MNGTHQTSWIRVLPVLGILGLALLLIYSRAGAETIVPHKPLALLPTELGDWQGKNEPLGADVLAILGPGDFVMRSYYNKNGQVPPVDVYMAYFPSQKAGDTIHSPKNCLPGAGWAALSSGAVTLTQNDGTPTVANRYVLGKGEDQLFVLYWYQAHGRTTASEYSAKFYLIADAMRMNRSDGGLVRIITPIAKNHESVEDAEHRAVTFVEQSLPSLDSYIPR